MISPEQYRALHERAGLVDRSNRGRLRLTGPDRLTYLQGLLTNDIEALPPGGGCYASLLTAQGRMISDMYVIETGEAVLMDVEPELTAKVFAHLEQFIFSEDVQVVDESASVAGLGVFGPSAAKVISGALPVSPSDLDAMPILANRTVAGDSFSPVVIVRRDDVGVPGFELLVERTRIEALANALRGAGAMDIDDATVDATRIEAGRPIFHKDMDEDTIPLEAGIEDRGISLTKGCYVGQEIIIRVLHRGHGRVARRLVGLTLDASAAVPVAGDRLRAGDRDIGRITSAAWSPALQRPIAMGYVHRDFAEPSTGVDVATATAVLPAVVTALPFVGGGEVKPLADVTGGEIPPSR